MRGVAGVDVLYSAREVASSRVCVEPQVHDEDAPRAGLVIENRTPTNRFA
jgi:hypothetical protein